jgi:hypothetical protein
VAALTPELLDTLLCGVPMRVPTVPMRVPALRVDADAIEREMHLGPCPSCQEKGRRTATCAEYLAAPDPEVAPGLIARLHTRYGRSDHSHAVCLSCGFVTMQLRGAAFDRYLKDLKGRR